MIPLAVVGIVTLTVIGLTFGLGTTEFSTPEMLVTGATSASASTSASDLPPLSSSASLRASVSSEELRAKSQSQSLAAKSQTQKALRRRKTNDSLVTQAAVKAAVLLKTSPIPDAVARLTGRTAAGASRLDAAFGVQNALEEFSQKAVKAAVASAAVAANAAVRAGLAYHEAPSYRELHGIESDTDSLVSASDSDSNLNPNALEVYNERNRAIVKKRKIFRRRVSVPNILNSESNSVINKKKYIYYSPDGPCVRIIKPDSAIPGAFPQKQMIEAATSTDPGITGIDGIQNMDDACYTCGRVGPSRVTPYNDIANQFHSIGSNDSSLKPTSSIFTSLVSTGTSVAGHFVAASSTYFLGKQTTEILLGSSEPVAAKDSKFEASPLSKEELFVKEATEEARKCFAASPIRCFCVGGIYCATTVRTLMRARGSKLKKWFTGIDGQCDTLGEDTVRDWLNDGVMMRDGTFFIDRDGTYFHHIINHLRGLALSPTLDSRAALHDLRQEALFYNIIPLIVEIDERLLCVEIIDEEEINDLEVVLMKLNQESADQSEEFKPSSSISLQRLNIGSTQSILSPPHIFSKSVKSPSPAGVQKPPAIISASFSSSNSASVQPSSDIISESMASLNTSPTFPDPNLMNVNTIKISKDLVEVKGLRNRESNHQSKLQQNDDAVSCSPIEQAVPKLETFSKSPSPMLTTTLFEVSDPVIEEVVAIMDVNLEPSTEIMETELDSTISMTEITPLESEIATTERVSNSITPTAAAEIAAAVVNVLPTSLANSQIVASASAAVNALPPSITNSYLMTSAFSFASAYLIPKAVSTAVIASAPIPTEEKLLALINPDDGDEAAAASAKSQKEQLVEVDENEHSLKSGNASEILIANNSDDPKEYFGKKVLSEQNFSNENIDDVEETQWMKKSDAICNDESLPNNEYVESAHEESEAETEQQNEKLREKIECNHINEEGEEEDEETSRKSLPVSIRFAPDVSIDDETFVDVDGNKSVVYSPSVAVSSIFAADSRVTSTQLLPEYSIHESDMLLGSPESTKTAATANSIKEKKYSQAEQKTTWRSAVSRSHEETLHRLLLKRRKWRMIRDLETDSGISGDTRSQIAELFERQSNSVAANSNNLIARTVKLINKSTWRNIATYNALRIEQGSQELTAYDDKGVKENKKAVIEREDLEVFIDSMMEKVGFFCGMPPPPRNDLAMNMTWAFGAGVVFALEISVVYLIFWIVA
ncbi:hypothetical protein HK100_011811 [Physocladia obscura]|uniref:Potassium channel tetramerisation-type BTB domain-containing protein n=1 Tax=Physocladia obscura TaxID=109957 RepID=A0AAD5XI21_9FUNG|nr:hypothetical protein HK100_011811 [Physocladia obscura]